MTGVMYTWFTPHNPKILWVDDADIDDDRITEVRPVSGNFSRRKLSVASALTPRHLRWATFLYSSPITLTCAATTNQPSGKRTQACICRPTLPGVVTRWNRVEAIAKSQP